MIYESDMASLTTIILAAGKGTRMKSAAPKVLHHVCGRPMIQYVLDAARAAGSLKTCVVIGHKNGLVRDYLRGVKVIVQKRLLGTADAVRCTKSYFKTFKGDALVLCADAPLLTKETLKKLIQKHRQSKGVCTFLTATAENPQSYGRIVRDIQGNVSAIREELDCSDEEKKIKEINSGIYCFKARELFHAVRQIPLNKKKKEFYLTDIIALFIENNFKVQTVQAEDACEVLGVNSREELAFVSGVMRRRILNRFMAEGVTIEDPATAFISADSKIGQDTTIRPYTVIERDVRIGRRCLIGPFCRIRPGSRIGNGVEVGNFTEISRSQIGDGTFMKHFSFLGDAKLGRQVNIGAGVVTANFDGKNKNVTRIFDNAFVGSDSILVAPVTIGKKAKTGAGSVVTRNTRIPNGAVAVGVPARIRRGK